MENQNNSLRMELLQRSTSILEYTKIDFTKYQTARLMLLAFTQDKSPDFQLWEQLIKVFENIITLQEKLKMKEDEKISRVVDELGRVVIPLEFRNILRN